MQRRRTIAYFLAALIAVAVVAAFILLGREPQSPSATNPSSSASQTPVTSASASAAASTTPASSPSAGSGVRPDARHGLIVATGNMRTEDDPRGLQEPSLFMTAPTTAYSISPDDKRVALIQTTQAGQRIVTFTTARPNDVTTVFDLASSGEVALHVVWAGDGSNSLLFAVVKRGPDTATTFSFEYSALRVVEIRQGDRDVVEIARVSDPAKDTQFAPLAWLPARQLAAALEISAQGTVKSYVLVRNAVLERTPLTLAPRLWTLFDASRDGERVLVSQDAGVRWWPVDQPGAAKDLSGGGARIGRAEFRPGADEIGVEVPEGGKLEVWSLSGQRRVVAERVGTFLHWRVDGTAAITSPDPTTVLLVDAATGTTIPLPGGGFPVADVVLF